MGAAAGALHVEQESSAVHASIATAPFCRDRVRRVGPVLGAVVLLLIAASPAHADAARADAPAGGAAGQEVVIAAIAAALFLLGCTGLLFARRRGQLTSLDRLAAVAERVSGLPGWAGLPLGIAGGSLVIAVVGFYWDVATHIDHGRDEGVFGNAAHWPILVGLLGLALAGLVSLLLGTDERRAGGWRLPGGGRPPVGGALLLLCGAIALLGFPIDDVWHRIFGQDVTLWSPPHVQMVLGASLCTIALWMLFVEAERSRPEVRSWTSVRLQEVALAGAVLIGMSTLQGEFDFGVPQFRLLYQPVLIVVAAGIALVPARIRLGRGGALLAVAFFLAARGLITALVTGALGHLTFHAPLYVGAAVAVELVAHRVPPERQVRFGAVAGLGIGTLGLAIEALWTHVWMPVAWSAALLPEAALVAVPAAVAAGVAGGFLGRALTSPAAPSDRVPTGVGLAALLVVGLALAYPLPTTGVDGRVSMVLSDPGAPQSHLDVRIEPAGATDGAEWVHVITWQGAEWWSDEHARLVDLEPLGDGVFRTSEPVPIEGDWKTMVRVHRSRVMAAAPVFLPEDTAIPADEVPALAETTRDLVPDEQILLREMRPAPDWIDAAAHAGMGLIAAGWLAAFVLGTRRLRLGPGQTAQPRGQASGARP